MVETVEGLTYGQMKAWLKKHEREETWITASWDDVGRITYSVHRRKEEEDGED